jgi:hypothetical protein
VTNNLQTVFACLHQDFWAAKRSPMTSLEKLLKIHASRIGKRKR